MEKIRIWFEAVGMFLKVLRNYHESVIGNELTLMQAWSLCYSLKSLKYERSIPFRAVIRMKREVRLEEC